MEQVPYIPVLIVYGFLAVTHFIPSLCSDWVLRSSRAIAYAGVSLHTIAFIGVVVWGGSPGFPQALSAAALGVMASYVFVVGKKTQILGMFLTPLGTVLLGTSLVVPGHQVAAMKVVGTSSAWLPIHLGLIFAGIGGFALAFAVGCAYLFVRDRLKRKKVGGLFRFPSLEVLDRIQFRATLSGFVFLTLGIAAGGAWAAASLEPLRTWDPKVLFTLLIWAWYGLGLQLRLVRGWRGRWAALFSIIGFAGLAFSLVLFNFVSTGWHSYGS